MDNNEAPTNAQRATQDFLFADGTMEEVARARFADRLFGAAPLLPEAPGVACRLTVNGRVIELTLPGPLSTKGAKTGKRGGSK